MAEVMYRNLEKKDSVHLDDWPSFAKVTASEIKLIEEMEIARGVVERAHAIRKQKQIPVKQPLNSFSTVSKPVSKNLEYLIEAELNVKSILWSSKTDKLDTKITPELEEEMKVRELIRAIQDERKQMGLNLTQRVNVVSNWLPTDNKLTQWVIRKAQINTLTKGKFNVRKV
jgi:isoleucyl-tRNA synthetase